MPRHSRAKCCNTTSPPCGKPASAYRAALLATTSRKHSPPPIHAELTTALAQHWRIIDIRSAAERAALAPPFASEHIPMPQLLAAPAAYLDAGAPVLLICASGQRAQNTARTLRAQGYAQVYAYGKAWAEATTQGGS